MLRTALGCLKKRQGLPHSKTLARSCIRHNKTKRQSLEDGWDSRPYLPLANFKPRRGGI